MNAARRLRQKSNRNPDTTHLHHNRAERTQEDGTVIRCLFCRPVRNDNEQNHTHGTQIFRRPVAGAIRWAASPHGKKVPAAAQPEPQAVKNLRVINEIQDSMGMDSKRLKTAVKKIEKLGSQRNG